MIPVLATYPYFIHFHPALGIRRFLHDGTLRECISTRSTSHGDVLFQHIDWNFTFTDRLADEGPQLRGSIIPGPTTCRDIHDYPDAPTRTLG